MRNPKFLGVYSRKDKRLRQAKSQPWFAWHLPDGNYAVQEIDRAYTARGPVLPVPRARFDALFKLEPSILAAPISTPDFSHLLTPAHTRPEPDEKALASLERARRARQIENDMRDSFSRSLKALLKPRDRKAAIASLERIAGASDGIIASHKHMFRDFGVALRKKALYRLAIACAQRAVDLAPEDDHARFNLARLLGIAGRYDDAERQLKIARKLDPAEKVYERLERHLERERRLEAAKLADS